MWSKVPLDQYGFRLCYALRSNNDLEGARRASIPFTVIVKAIAIIPTMAIDFGTSNSCVWYEYKAKTLPVPVKKIVDPAAINFFRNLRTLKIDKDVMTELDADSHGDGYLRACSIIKTGMLYSMDPSGNIVSTVMDESDPRSITLFKRDLASGKTYTISNAAGRQASLTPEQITTDFLRLLLQSAIKEVGMPERLVVTHPVVFDSHQLKALKDAVVSVYDGDIRWVDEARAAMFRYALYRKDLLARKIEKGRIRKDQYGETAVVVLFDLGGGTLDVTSARLDMTLSRDGAGGGAEIGKGYFSGARSSTSEWTGWALRRFVVDRGLAKRHRGASLKPFGIAEFWDTNVLTAIHGMSSMRLRPSCASMPPKMSAISSSMPRPSSSVCLGVRNSVNSRLDRILGYPCLLEGMEGDPAGHAGSGWFGAGGTDQDILRSVLMNLPVTRIRFSGKSSTA